MRYKIIGAAGMAAYLAFGSAALAADLIQPPPPLYVEPPVAEEDERFDWDRFYVGLVGGYGFAAVDVTTDNPPSFFDRSFDISGPMLGITVGRNFLIGNDDEGTEEDERRLLLGIEADIAYAWMRGEARGIVDREYMAAGIDAIGTLRARIGIPLGEERRVLPYLTGGLAAAHAYAELQTDPNSAILRADNWLWGYTIGGGLEVATGEDVTIKLEYLYTDIAGRVTINNVGGGGINTADYDFRANHLVRVGLNYHF